MNSRKLTAKQVQFCFEYLANGMNGTKAALKAGYSPRTAHEIARENLKKPEIEKEISQMQDNLARTAGITALMIAQEHAKIAFSDITSLHNTWIARKEINELSADQRSCIQEVSTKVTKVNIGTKEQPIIADVEYVKIKTYDKQKALDSLSNLFGFNAPVRKEVTGKNGMDLIPARKPEDMTDEELDRHIAMIEKKLSKI